MPSRRRSRTKNLGTNLADVQRRMRYLERRPVRTKLQRKVVTAVNIAPETITADEVSFGTAVITTETDTNNANILNPKDGLLVVSSTNGSSSVYSGNDDSYYQITDTVAQAEATAAAEAAAAADAAATQAAIDAAAADAAATAAAEEAAAAAEAAALAEAMAQDAQDTADAAASSAQDALDVANYASDSANKKNTVFRQPAPAPMANKDGDIWFDTTPISGDSGGSRPKRWNGTTSQWEAFGLSYAAITSIDADTITTGTLTGRTIQTSSSGKRIEMSNTDRLIFRGDDGTTVVGEIGPNLYSGGGLNLSGGDSPANSPLISMYGDYTGDSSIYMALPSSGASIQMYSTSDVYNGTGGIVIAAGGATTPGGLSLISGAGGFSLVDWSGSAYGTTIYAYDDSLSIGSGQISISGDTIQLGGEIVLSAGTYAQGASAPTGTPAGGEGTIIFKYV